MLRPVSSHWSVVSSERAMFQITGLTLDTVKQCVLPFVGVFAAFPVSYTARGEQSVQRSAHVAAYAFM